MISDWMEAYVFSHGSDSNEPRSRAALWSSTSGARRFPRSCLLMADSFPPAIAPQTDSSGNAPDSAQQSPDPAEPVPITEQEVGEYREQDRYLPVSLVSPSSPFPLIENVRPWAPRSPPPSLFSPPLPPLSRRCGGANALRVAQIANVSRIMKNAVPPTAKIAKDAKECVQECVSEFISFITSEAAEKCQLEKRKTIGGEDILYAMVSLGFEN